MSVNEASGMEKKVHFHGAFPLTSTKRDLQGKVSKSLRFLSCPFFSRTLKKWGGLIWNQRFESALLFNYTFISVLPLSSSVYVIHWTSYGAIKTKGPKEPFYLFNKSTKTAMKVKLRIRFRQRIHVLKGEFASNGNYYIY